MKFKPNRSCHSWTCLPKRFIIKWWKKRILILLWKESGVYGRQSGFRILPGWRTVTAGLSRPSSSEGPLLKRLNIVGCSSSCRNLAGNVQTTLRIPAMTFNGVTESMTGLSEFPKKRGWACPLTKNVFELQSLNWLVPCLIASYPSWE